MGNQERYIDLDKQIKEFDKIPPNSTPTTELVFYKVWSLENKNE